MGKIEDIFEFSWDNVVKLYKKDWIDNLKVFDGDAIKMYPTNFYSEADLQSQLTCELRKNYKKERYYGSEIYVKNQLTFSAGAFESTPELSDRISKLKDLMMSRTEKERFIPDIAIEADSNSNGGAFLLFAELKYGPDFMLNYGDEVPGYFRGFIENLELQCQTMEMAVKQKVCTSGYVCAINDGYVSHDGRKKLFDQLKGKYKKVTFLIDGLSVEQKEEYLKA